MRKVKYTTIKKGDYIFLKDEKTKLINYLVLIEKWNWNRLNFDCKIYSGKIPLQKNKMMGFHNLLFIKQLNKSLEKKWEFWRLNQKEREKYNDDIILLNLK